MPKDKYRISKDKYCGYCLEIKRWWFPFWLEVYSKVGINTFSTVEKCEQFYKDVCNPVVKELPPH